MDIAVIGGGASGILSALSAAMISSAPQPAKSDSIVTANKEPAIHFFILILYFLSVIPSGLCRRG